jgi:hypothetical protein
MSSFQGCFTAARSYPAWRKSLLALVLAGGACVYCSEAKALTLVPSRADLDAGYYVDWSQFGVPNTLAGNPSTANTSQSTNVEVSKLVGGTFQRRNQNMLPGAGPGWAGNFAPGDPLLWTNNSTNTINTLTLKLPAGILGVGTQIQANQTGDFSAEIEAFDAGSMSLGSFTLSGKSTTDANNTALFIGVRNPTPIASVALRLLTASSLRGSYAINQVNFSANFTPDPPTVPAPLPLVGAATGYAVSRRLRARIKAERLRCATMPERR